MVTVNYNNVNLHRIEKFAILFKIYGNYIVTTLRSKTYGNLTVTAVNGNRAIGILKTDNLIAG